MNYVFNVVMGNEKIAENPERSEISGLDDALREANQIARDVSIEELRQGRAVGARGRLAQL